MYLYICMYIYINIFIYIVICLLTCIYAPSCDGSAWPASSSSACPELCTGLILPSSRVHIKSRFLNRCVAQEFDETSVRVVLMARLNEARPQRWPHLAGERARDGVPSGHEPLVEGARAGVCAEGAWPAAGTQIIPASLGSFER